MGAGVGEGGSPDSVATASDRPENSAGIQRSEIAGSKGPLQGQAPRARVLLPSPQAGQGQTPWGPSCRPQRETARTRSAPWLAWKEVPGQACAKLANSQRTAAAGMGAKRGGPTRSYASASSQCMDHCWAAGADWCDRAQLIHSVGTGLTCLFLRSRAALCCHYSGACGSRDSAQGFPFLGVEQWTQQDERGTQAGHRASGGRLTLGSRS